MAEVVRLQLLGGFGASKGERTVANGAWRLRKAKTLVKLLALEPGHALHRDHVIDALWPNLDVDAGRNNLNQVLFAARRALSTLGVEGGATITLQDELLMLGPGVAVVTDVEELMTAVERAESSGDQAGVAGLLQQLPSQLLPEDVYEPWLQAAAGRFREWRTKVVMAAAESQFRVGAADAAVVLVAPVVASDPLHEPAVRLLMRALTESGRRSEALLVYERLRNSLRDELGADPEPSTRQLFRAVLAGSVQDVADPAGFGGEVTVPIQRGAHGLPAAVTKLIGRERELEETAAILGRSRLLTLTGLGGAGKTSLALELARRRAAAHGGAQLVELGAVTDAHQVAPAVARALHVDLPPDAQSVDAIVTRLGHARLLIVLDNCEHQLEACAVVVSALLRGCPGVSVVATSREPLRIDGEVSWRTPSLELPDPREPGSADELSRVASVALFVERASAAAPGFALSEGNAAAVAEVCYRLDGIPLAIELAAACVPLLSPQQIVDRLGNALDLLRRGERAGVTRQRTLLATLTWSHDLLDAAEQLLFRRLSVFAGSFTLDAVEGVCGEGLEPIDVLTALARLVDTSLVAADARDDVTRYRLLETVRQFAAECLATAGEQRVVQQLHSAWFLRYAQERNPERAASATRIVPLSLDIELDNVRAALSWSLEQDPTTALQLAVAMWRLWLARGMFVEGGRWLEAGLEVSPAPTPLRAEALTALAVFDVRRGQAARLEQLGAEAVEIHRTLGGDKDLAQALHADAVLAFMRGEWADALLRAEESRAVARTALAPQLDIAATHLRAVVLLGQGRLAEARAAFDSARAMLPSLPADRPPFLLPVLLGYYVEGHATAHPRVYFEETVLLGRRVGAEQADAYFLCNLADLARFDGDLDGSCHLGEQALEAFRAIGDKDGEALACSRLGCLHRSRGDFSAARTALSSALSLRRRIGDRRGIGLAQSNLGVLAACEGDTDYGRTLIERAVDGAREIDDEPARVGLTLTLASVYADAGAYDAAERALCAALPESGRLPGNARATAWGWVVLADVLRQLGRTDDANDAVRSAQQRFAALGAVDGTVALRRRGAETAR